MRWGFIVEYRYNGKVEFATLHEKAPLAAKREYSCCPPDWKKVLVFFIGNKYWNIHSKVGEDLK